MRRTEYVRLDRGERIAVFVDSYLCRSCAEGEGEARREVDKPTPAHEETSLF